MTTYEPGTVALIGWKMTNGRERAIFNGENWQTETGITVGLSWVTDVRPLVALDPSDADQVDRLTKAIVEAADRHGNVTVSNNGIHPDTTAEALRSLIHPPKPEEPTGRYAIVIADGVTWCRAAWAEDRPWSRVGTDVWADWAELDVTSIEFAGVDQ